MAKRAGEAKNKKSAPKKNGFFRRVFCSYDRIQHTLDESGAAKLAKRINSPKSRLSSLRNDVCRYIAESRVLTGFGAFAEKLLYIRTRDIGIWLFSAAIYAALEYIIITFADIDIDIGSGVIYSAAAMLIASLFFMSGRSLVNTVHKNRLLSFIVFEFFGVDREKLKLGNAAIKNTSIALLLGMITGLLSFAVDPAMVLLVIGLFILFYLIMLMPEAGAVLTAAVVPFANPETVAVICAVTLISFFVKVFRRKREMRFSALDVSVMILALITFIGRITSIGVSSSEGSLYLICISAYLICKNLLCRREWLKRAFCAAAASCAFVSCFGLFFTLFGKPESLLTSRSLFSDLSSGMSMFFGSPDVLAAYLVITSPFLLYLALTAKNRRIAFYIAYVMSLACLVLTLDVFAVISAVAAGSVVLFLYNKRIAIAAVPSVVAVAFAAILIPPSAFDTVSSLFKAKYEYMTSVWAGAVRLIGTEFFEGAGIGSFRYAYHYYALPGYGTAENAQSLYFQLASEGGVILLIVFAAAIFIFISCCLTQLSKTAEKRSNAVIYASLTAVIAVMLYGFTDSVVVDNRICTLIFAVIGIGAAAAETAKRESDYESAVLSYPEAFNEK